jgi:hypothetical protein
LIVSKDHYNFIFRERIFWMLSHYLNNLHSRFDLAI